MLVEAGATVIVTDVDPDKVDRAAAELGVTAVEPDAIYDQDVDIFAPYALGAVINDDTVPRLKVQDRRGRGEQHPRRGAPRRRADRARDRVRGRLHRQLRRHDLRHRPLPQGRLPARAGDGERAPRRRPHARGVRDRRPRRDRLLPRRRSARRAAHRRARRTSACSTAPTPRTGRRRSAWPPWTAAFAASSTPTAGRPPGYEPALSDEQLVGALRAMLRSRAFDGRCFSLQRQGRLGTFSPVDGEEAAVVGTALALDPGRDWVVPQYRELPAMLHWATAGRASCSYFRATRPATAMPEGVNVLPFQISLAAQLPHAVGLAWGLRHQGARRRRLRLLRRRRVVGGRFHEALNLAGVRRRRSSSCSRTTTGRSRPRCEADRRARRSPRGPRATASPASRRRQRPARGARRRAREAVARARAGEGPTLIEARTYRLGPHNTADDPTRYVDPDELERAAAGATRSRALRRYLRARGLVDDGALEATASRRSRPRSTRPSRRPRRPRRPAPSALFDHVYADPPRRGAGSAPQREEAALMTVMTHGRGDPRDARRRAGARRARHRARPGHRTSTAACSAPPTGCRSASAPTGSSTCRSPRRRSSAPPSGSPCSGLVPVRRAAVPRLRPQAFHQIEDQVARMRFRSQGRYPMPMVIRAPFGGGVRTPELHSDALEAKYAHSPGLKIVDAGHGRRRQGAAGHRDPRPGPGAVLRAAARLPADQATRCPRRTTPCRSARRASRARATTS